MLSQEDRRRLAVIERQLTIEDPTLADRFARHRCGQTSRTSAALVLGSLGLLATVVVLLPTSVLLAVLAAAPILVAMCLALRWAWRHPR
jgi:hypothetical protein